MMKNILLISFLLSQLYLTAPLLAAETPATGNEEPAPVNLDAIANYKEPVPSDGEDDKPLFGQPGPANYMLFDRLHSTLKAPEKAYPAIDLKVGGIENGKQIPEKFAYCAPDGNGKTINGGNISPAIHWLNPPAATQSFVIMVVDPDVPASFDDANKPDKEIRAKTPRQDFYHWVAVDIPATSLGLFEGASSRAITPGGKQAGRRPYGIDGMNDYSKVFGGTYGGYDGPCPPWNDLRLHHYHFILYALDIPSLGLPHPIKPLQARSAMKDHIIAKGEVVGTYSNNPRWLAQFKKDKEIVVDPNSIPGTRFDPKKQ